MAELKDITLFLVTTVLIKYIVVQWLADQLGRFIKRFLTRGEDQVIAWVHYKKQAMNQGHKPKRPLNCQDGDCAKLG